MHFEFLPNEIFLDIFDYFNEIDLFYTFSGLNSRFNNLLYQQYRTFHFDFRSISKRHFDMICQQHFPMIADRVIALSFSDDIPEQINLFFLSIRSLDHFTHLQSLSLYAMHSHERTMKIIDQCHYLSHLTHLKIHFNYFYDFEDHFQSIVDNIWSLTNLVYCEMDCSTWSEMTFYIPKNISLSLEHLSLEKSKINFNQINTVLQQTPRLKYFSGSVDNNLDDYLPTLLPTLISFKICVSEKYDNPTIVLLLRNMPNLHSLQIDISDHIIDGYQWEDLIRNYLPKLNRFQFRMKNGDRYSENLPGRMIELIEPFRSSFWIAEHRWFVRGFALEKIVYLCTLPNTFPQVNISPPEFLISTDPDDDLQKFCNDTTDISQPKFFGVPITKNIRLTNIHDLQTHFPLNDQFWSIVPSLNQLHTLTVDVNVEIPQAQFQALLDRAPHLHQLIIRADNPSCVQISSVEHINPSLCQLDIQYNFPYFKEEECLTFAHSPLGVQCEVLSIEVCNRESIPVLVNNMSRLRLLKIFCQDITYLKYLKTERDDLPRRRKILSKNELIQWLREHLPSTYIIAEPTRFSDRIRIWM